MYFLKWFPPAHLFTFFQPVLSWPSFSAVYSSRTRRILQEAHEEGRPCPSQLTQTKPCPIRPCYRWLVSDWSPCTLEVRLCLFIYLFIYSFTWLDRKTWSLSKTPPTQPLTLVFWLLSISMPTGNISQILCVFVHLCRALSVVRGFRDGTWRAWSTGGTGPSLPHSQCSRSFVATKFWGGSSRRWRSPASSPVQVKLQIHLISFASPQSA